MRSRNSRRVAVLGSGIVGSLATKLIPDSIVLTKRKTDLFLDNTFFHDTIENRLLLMLFGIEFNSKLIPVQYYNFETNDISYHLTSEIASIISKEKMGGSSTVISNMTEDEQDFVNLQFDRRILKDALLASSDQVVLFPTMITEYDDRVRVWIDHECIDFEYLINTIPQPFFQKIFSSEIPQQEFKYSSITFVTSKCDVFSSSMMYSYNGCPWKRVFIIDGTQCIEFDTNDFSADVLHQNFPLLKNYSVVHLPYGRIKSDPIKDTNRIKHIGRFAQWDHRITTEHTIRKLLNLNLK